jgi:hypothetical protein
MSTYLSSAYISLLQKYVHLGLVNRQSYATVIWPRGPRGLGIHHLTDYHTFSVEPSLPIGKVDICREPPILRGPKIP